ncbi:hypothetical protein [Brachybacterium alimentarium]|uniref:hypothetical protein n=1 Tax=Brachybacterium alimentarium TaxID=47845 RepID=UPI000DF31DC5|nr:hypothetical protein [Brachybacterium alimentarium]RCS65228.1 hypothetical protein CIK68_17225 [Brachybacterium alimentarium]RCS79708.1 hypothetical protein CIK67_17750 [Brachybacterium alimentarium]RCS85317.1 hypothetical protein CIK69_16895 [Brachybacterium alimentarium]
MTAQLERPADDLVVAAMSRRQAEVATLDYRRALKHLDSQGRPQSEVARVLGVSQPALSQSLKAARKVVEVAPGFSGAGPYEICQRYSLGQLTREQLIEELVRWEYAPIPEPEWLEDIVPSPGPGSWREVQKAHREGLIDDGTYDEVADRKYPQAS